MSNLRNRSPRRASPAEMTKVRHYTVRTDHEGGGQTEGVITGINVTIRGEERIRMFSGGCLHDTYVLSPNMHIIKEKPYDG